MPTRLGAHDFVVNIAGDVFQVESSNANPQTAPGLQILLSASYPEAAYDSSSHPTSCFPGTRTQYIEDITGWAQPTSTKRRFPMMWLKGPAGVGKSALAQSCAENLGTKLAAAFFFSRSNSRILSTRLFPSVAYQLASKHPLYRDKLNEKLSRDPTLVDKSIVAQFRELIMIPFLELQGEGYNMEEGVIVIDGLDECVGEDAQCAVIDVISASSRDQSSPFIWAVFSRPEPRIVAQFEAPHVHDLCWQLTLPISHDADGDVELYLQDGFQKIRAQFGIPLTSSWPSKGEITELVQRSAGLFVYPASVIRFVGDRGLLGPREQLQLILSLSEELPRNPWSHLDSFYTLIMEQIPKEIMPNVMKLLLYHAGLTRQAFGNRSVVAAAVLGFSLSTYCAALSTLHSAVQLTWTDTGVLENISFYHTSFTDFLENGQRSKEFCVTAPEIRTALFVDMIKHLNDGFDKIILPWQGIVGMQRSEAEWCVKARVISTFWELASCIKLDESLLQQLSECDYRNLAKVKYSLDPTNIHKFFHNILLSRRQTIIRPYDTPRWKRLFRRDTPTTIVYILGTGEKSCDVTIDWRGRFLCQNRGVPSQQTTFLGTLASSWNKWKSSRK